MFSSAGRMASALAVFSNIRASAQAPDIVSSPELCTSGVRLDAHASFVSGSSTVAASRLMLVAVASYCAAFGIP